MTTRGVTAQDIPWLVYGAQRLQEETYGCKVWDKQGTDVIFARELIGMNFRVAVELVLAHATDPDAQTPGAIKRPFKPNAPSTPTSSNPTAATACELCGRVRGNCICHHEKRRAVEEEIQPMTKDELRAHFAANRRSRA